VLNKLWKALRSRRTFVSVACGCGFFLLVYALWVSARLLFGLPSALTSSDNDLKDRAAACASLFNILAIAITGIWFLVRLVVQRQYDAAIKLAATARQLSRSSTLVELVAQLQNATSVAAGIDLLEWQISDARTGRVVGRGGWNWPRPGPVIITRDSLWQLARVVRLRRPGTYKLTAICQIGLQPPEQTIYHESIFSIVRPNPPLGPPAGAPNPAP
jgi:hypothetical protein